MANPITWRTVTGPDTADAARPMYYAQQSFNGAFDALNKALSQRNEAVQQEQEKTKKNNFESFMSHMNQFSTPEEFQQAVQSGSLNQMAEGFGPDGIDRAAVRAAMDARPGILMDQAQQANEFSDYNMTRKQRGTRDNIMNQLYKGDIEGAQAQLAANPDMFNSAEIQKQISEFQRQQVLEGRDDQRFAWDGENHKWGVAAKQAGIAASTLSQEQSRLTIDELRKNIQNEDTDRGATDAFNTAIDAHRQNFVSIGREQASIAESLGLPVKDGLPDYQTIESNPAMLDLFNHATQTAGVVLPSDTEGVEAALNMARQSGGSAQLLNQLRGGAGQAVSTSPENMLYGADLETLQRNTAAVAEAQAEAEAKNSLFISGNNVLDQLPSLQQTLKDSGLDDGERRSVAKVVQTYLKEHPDTPLHIPAIINAAVTSRSWGDGFWDTFGNPLTTYEDSLKANLQSATNTAAYREQTKQYHEYNGSQALRDREALLNATRNAGVPTRTR